jgi:hypothetical protein
VVWLTGEVETASGALVDGPLVLDLPFGAGRIVYVSFAAAEPRSDEWWQGSPSAWSLPDGSWDGRGTIVDRMLLRL